MLSFAIFPKYPIFSQQETAHAYICKSKLQLVLAFHQAGEANLEGKRKEEERKRFRNSFPYNYMLHDHSMCCSRRCLVCFFFCKKRKKENISHTSVTSFELLTLLVILVYVILLFPKFISNMHYWAYWKIYINRCTL